MKIFLEKCFTTVNILNSQKKEIWYLAKSEMLGRNEQESIWSKMRVKKSGALSQGRYAGQQTTVTDSPMNVEPVLTRTIIPLMF